MCQKACTGSAKEVPCKKEVVKGIKGYPTMDWNANHIEGYRKMDKENQVSLVSRITKIGKKARNEKDDSCPQETRT
jgi:hypothetical protein